MFLYSREAHPGEAVPAHDSMETKLAHAALLRDEVGIRRPILVDDLGGTAHRAYGGLPNMTWVFDRGGRVAFKANWTNAANVEAFVVRYLRARDARHGGKRQAMYQTEQLEFREVDDTLFQERLDRNGPRAVTEFARAREIWASRSGT